LTIIHPSDINTTIIKSGEQAQRKYKKANEDAVFQTRQLTLTQSNTVRAE
jgi:hypothetical protein